MTRHLFKIMPFFAFPAGVFIIHALALKFLDLYSIFPNIDIPFHFVGGVAIAYTTAKVLNYFQAIREPTVFDKVVSLTLILTMTATAAIFWEFAEFMIDRTFSANVQVSLANTMQDQFLGVLGGCFVVIINLLGPSR